MDEPTSRGRNAKSGLLLSIYRAGRPFGETSEAVLATLAAGEGWRAAALWVPDANDRSMIAVATWVADPSYERFATDTRDAALMINSSTVGRCWRTGEPLWIDDVATSEAFLRKDLLIECGLPTVSFIPVEHDGRVLGVLEFLGSSPAGDPLQQVEVTRDVLNGLGGLLHTHISGEQMRQQQVRLDLAMQAGRMGSWEWDRRSGHVVWSETLERMYGFAPGGFPGTYGAYQERIHPDDRAYLAQTLADTLESHRDHHVLHRIVLPDGSIRWIEGHGRARLDSNGTLIGLSGVSTDVTEREQLLASLAAQVELTQEALADRSKVADTLQRSLRPDRLPAIDGVDLATGFRPGHEIVGGDFYDGFRHDDSWYLYIGDVCGHGPEAAAQTGLARHAIRGLVAAGVVEPAAILQQLNRILLEAPTERFVSLVLARITRGTSLQVSLCRAGHPLPITRTCARQTRLLDLVPGTLLGLTPSVQLADQTLTMDRGDALVLYTDGVTEARRGDDLLGETRLLEAVERGPSDAAGLVNHLLDTVQRFQARPAVDDLAILAIVAD